MTIGVFFRSSNLMLVAMVNDSGWPPEENAAPPQRPKLVAVPSDGVLPPELQVENLHLPAGEHPPAGDAEGVVVGVPGVPERATWALPTHVRDSFHAESKEAAKQLGAAWDYGWRVGNIVLIKVSHPDRAAWSSRTREELQVDGVRIVRPVRSTDGRFINAGWRASTHVPGILSGRVDETVAAALRLDEALAQLPIPDSFHSVDPKDAFSVADYAAWRDEHDVVILDPAVPAQETAGHLVPRVRDLLRPIVDAEGNRAANQVTHADMFATTIYSGHQPPTVTDLVGVAHPKGYTAALAIVDALLMNAVDTGILDRFSHIEHLDQLVLRGLLYRLYVHAMHPLATANTGTNLELVCQAVVSKVRGRI